MLPTNPTRTHKCLCSISLIKFFIFLAAYGGQNSNHSYTPTSIIQICDNNIFLKAGICCAIVPLTCTCLKKMSIWDASKSTSHPKTMMWGIMPMSLVYARSASILASTIYALSVGHLSTSLKLSVALKVVWGHSTVSTLNATALFSHDAESMPIGSVQDALPRGPNLSPQ